MASSTESPGTGLVFTSDDQPGIVRTKRGRGFSYRMPDGAPVKDRAILDRIRALAIPPAYTQVWICLKTNGHLQATGRDARGRKQYRYHADYRAAQDLAKFSRLVNFGERLPIIREQVDSAMRSNGTRAKCVIATIVYLLDSTTIRIGNPVYAADNGSFGLTTLRQRHVRLDASTIRFRFKGKSGRKWDLSVRNRRVARIIRGLQELPGQDLFSYVDGGGVKPVSSNDINGYLREIGGEDFSAKDFRTWHGTVLAAVSLAQMRQGEVEMKPEAAIRQALVDVSAVLHNTPTVCRQSYVHPAVFDAYRDDHPMFTTMALPHEPANGAPHFAGAERDVLAFIKTIAASG